jgi:non-heme chloroperoxidase
VSLIGFSTGGGEVARYVGRHGTGRVARIGLISAVPPIMLRTENNPIGLPIEVLRQTSRSEYHQPLKLYRDIASAHSSASTGLAPRSTKAWSRTLAAGMTAGHKNAYDASLPSRLPTSQGTLRASTTRHSSFNATTTGRGAERIAPRAR